MPLRLPLSVLACTVATLSAQARELPVVGGYGFDWLKPSAARCKPIRAADAARFDKCTFSPTGAFGLDLPFHSCTTPAGAEYLVFASRTACREALETMEANAP